MTAVTVSVLGRPQSEAAVAVAALVLLGLTVFLEHLVTVEMV